MQTFTPFVAEALFDFVMMSVAVGSLLVVTTAGVLAYRFSLRWYGTPRSRSVPRQYVTGK